MKTLEDTLKKLSMLYEFNRKLRAFTTSTKGKQASQTTEPGVAAGSRQSVCKQEKCDEDIGCAGTSKFD